MSNACLDQHVIAILMVLTPRKPVFTIVFSRALCMLIPVINITAWNTNFVTES